MWPVSPRFLTAISQPHTVDTTITCTPPGGTARTLRLVSGSWQSTSGALVRRTSSLVIDGGSAIYDLVSTPGAVLRVKHGIRWSGTDSELVPIITGELSAAATTLGDGTLQLTVADFGQRLARCSYLSPVTPAASASRIATISDAVTSAIPGTSVVVTASDLGAIGVAQQWSNRTDLITDLATDGGAEGFFQPDGSYLIRDLPVITGTPVWLLKTGAGGTVKSVARQRPLDKLYNTVIVKPSSSDATQGWTQQIAQISDPSNPRHPSRIGVAPLEWTSPTLLTASAALAVAGQLLTKVQGSTETLSIGAVANPALDAGDVVRVLTPTDAGPALETHLLDSISGDLITGDMTCATRAAAEVIGS